MSRSGRPVRRSMYGICLAGLVFTSVTSIARAQAVAFDPEMRGDVIVGRSVAEEIAGGASATSGDFVSLVGDIGVGAIAGDRRGLRLGARVDALARLHLDPSTASRWAPYIVGGASYLADARERGRVALVV